MQRLRLRTLSVSAAASSAMLMACAQVHAQTYTNTFDTSASFLTGNANRTYNPPPTWAGLSYGGTAPLLHNEAVWSPIDHTGNSGGSLELSWKFNEPADGSNGNGSGTGPGGGESAGFVLDLEPSPGVTFSSISFYVMVDPRTATNSLGTGSTLDAYGGYGYFQIAAADTDAYNYDSISNISVNGTNEGGGYELGNPNYTGSDAGTWEHVTAPITTADTRALYIQDFNDYEGRNIDGYETIYIDDLVLTPVPEPASISLLALGLPALLKRRRKA